jgi:hypothetical protein
MNIIKITAIVTNPEGKEIFRSEHKQAVPPDAEAKMFFADMVPPLERILSDAHRKFLPTDEEAAADQE